MRCSPVFAASERAIGVSETPSPDRLQGIHALFARCFLTVDTRACLPLNGTSAAGEAGDMYPSLLLQLRVTLSVHS